MDLKEEYFNYLKEQVSQLKELNSYKQKEIEALMQVLVSKTNTIDIKQDERYRLIEQQSAIIQETTDGVVLLNEKGIFEYVNEAFLNIYDFKNFNEINDKMWHILYRPKDIKYLENEVLPVVEKDKKWSGELKSINSNGIYFFQTLNILKLENQKYVFIIRDITQIKKTEQELIKQVEIAENSLKMKEQFLANMSHEIRTPLNAIAGMLYLLKQQNQTNESIELINTMQNSAESLQVIINDILDFSKIKSGKFILEKAHFLFDEMLTNIHKTFALQAKEKGLEMKMERTNTLPEALLGDSVRIKQILINLINNAIKFTKEGYVKLSVSQLQNHEGFVELLFKVNDTGIGIPQDKIAYIFDSFTQACEDTTRKFGGTGLGLAICKNLVELHNGTISVKSHLNEGSEFSFTLKTQIGDPAKVERKDESLEKKLIAADRIQNQNLKILVAEDTVPNQMLIKKLLALWNFQYDLAENGNVAIAKLKENHFDLILMDIQMPECDGYTATKIIRTELALPKSNIPIIALTANASQEDAFNFKEKGLDDFISKPLNRELLYNKLRQYVIKKQSITNTNNKEDVSKIIDIQKAKNDTTALKTELEPIDLSYIESMAEGSSQFVFEMLDTIAEELEVAAPKLKSHLEKNDHKGTQAVSHKMKSLLKMLGLNIKAEEAKEIEVLSKACGDFSFIKSKSENLLTNIPHIINAVKNKRLKLAA
jgi:PAS domain S-box-containing protein